MISAFDLDGTLLVKNSSFAFCFYLFRKKFLSVKEFFSCVLCYLRHKYFGASLQWLHTSVFKRLFRGKKISDLEPLIEAFLSEHLERLLYLPAVSALKKALQTNRVIILSNSPDLLVKPIAKRLGCSESYSTKYKIDQSGRLCEIAHLLDGKAKAEVLKKLEFSSTEAYSDSILDLPFLEAAGVKFVVRPDRKLAKVAKAKGWKKV